MSTLRFRTRLAVILGLFAVSTVLTVRSVNAEGMIGTWNMTVKVDEKAAEQALAAADEQQKAVLQQLLPAMKGTTGTLDIRQDGTYTFTIKTSLFGQTQTHVEEGVWNLVKKDGKKIVVETTEKGKEKPDTHEITQIDKDHFQEGAPKEMGPLASVLKMDFRRKK